MTSHDGGAWLTRDEFGGAVQQIARDLLGRTLRVASSESTTVDALIVETEAYGGIDDPASHAAFKPGGRAAIMWRAPGLIYVYAAYGMYPCLNIVCAADGMPAAVLIRGVWANQDAEPTLGPGRTSRRLGVTLEDQGQSVDGPRFRVSRRRCDCPVLTTRRIGITREVERPWRFLLDTKAIARFDEHP
jgi:DNA-3-methyladenine glycosylase